MPAVFIGHGSPMNTLEHNRFTEVWADVGETVPRPRAILAISAHWYIGAVAVTAMASPRTIHDFSGFPPELFAFEYPAPGEPDVASHIAHVLHSTGVDVTLDTSAWGIDHGTWSVLAHMYPNADVPVVQLSIDARLPIGDHLAIGSALHALRHEGILVVCSGNVVHNLSLMEWSRPEAGFDWALEFDAAAREIMTTHPERIADLADHPQWRRSVPTPEHFLPLVYLAGLARTAGQCADVLVAGPVFGSLTMTSYMLADITPA